MSWRQRLRHAWSRPADAHARRIRFPRRSPLASLGHHLALDVGEDAIYWARSKPAHDGLRLLEWDRISLDDGTPPEAVLQQIGRTPWVRFAHVEVPIRSPDLRHKRVLLPPLAPSAARKVGKRRVAEFLQEAPEPCIGSFMRTRQPGAHPLWLVALPSEAPALFERRWEALGFQVHRLSSEPLALGNLARLLPALPIGELTAIFDLHQDGGDCVICDDRGWHFNRMIPIRQMRSWGGAADAPGSDKTESLSTAQMERVATELQRTFQYVDRELQLGRVTRVALAGECPDLEALAAHLSTSLSARVRPIGDLVEQGPARGMDPAAARAVGLAMAPDCRGCSLLLPATKARRRAARARRTIGMALAAAAVACSAGVLHWGFQFYTGTREIERMREEIRTNDERARIIAEAAQVRARARQVDQAIARIERSEPAWDVLLAVLGLSIPGEVALEQLEARYADGSWTTKLSLEARGASVSDAAERVAEFRSALARTPLIAISQADRDASRQTVQESDRARVFFQMTGELAIWLRSRNDPAAQPSSPQPSVIAPTSEDPSGEPVEVNDASN